MQPAYQVQITEGAHTFVMAAGGVAVVDRDELEVAGDSAGKGAIRLSRNGQVRDAVRLAHLLAVEAGEWWQALFLDDGANARPVVLVHGAKLVERNPAGVARPFTVIGGSLEGGPLFDGVWIGGVKPHLVIDRDRLEAVAARFASP